MQSFKSRYLYAQTIAPTETASKAISSTNPVDEVAAASNDGVRGAHQGGVGGESSIGRRSG